MRTAQLARRLLHPLAGACILAGDATGCVEPGPASPATASAAPAAPAAPATRAPTPGRLRAQRPLDHAALRAALDAARREPNGGFGPELWATVVDRSGVVVAVVFTGDRAGDPWPGNRVLSAQKANAANAFSLPDLALSTANLYSAVQPGGRLFGLQESHPVDPAVAQGGWSGDHGTARDHMVGRLIGGTDVLGGGLPLYDATGALVGAVGVSGDTPCADHNVAWKVRDRLGLDHVPAGVSATGDDNAVYDIAGGTSASGWGHPVCSAAATTIGNALPTTHPRARG